MFWGDNIHSRLVAWMKIILPLVALGILSTMFLFSRNFDPGETLPVVGIDLQQRAQDQGATNATFAGVTRTGDQVIVQTEQSRPSADNPRVFLAEDVMARYKLNSGTGIDIVSDRAEMNQQDNTATLAGDVHVDTTTGYRMRTDFMTANFDDLYAESPGPVSGQAPAGDLTAGRMVLQSRSDTGVAHLVFTDGVN